MSAADRTAGQGPEVTVVGGGPTGAIVAMLLARAGRSVTVHERAPAWHWRACGVFASPATVAALRALGVDDGTIRAAARPVPAMRVETPDGTRFRLTYGDDGSAFGAAVGFDRSVLDPALLQIARGAGARIVAGATVRAEDGRLVDAAGQPIAARLVVGADGIRSVVARAARVSRPARLRPRVGLTFHVADPRPDRPRDARMILFRDGYVGLAPTAGGRVNVGIVLGGRWRDELRSDGAEAVVRRVLAAVPDADDDPIAWSHPDLEPLDRIEGAAPVGHRVASRAGRLADGGAWLVAGDAAGFLDPFTGEGLHRAVVTAGLAARAAERHLDGDRDALTAFDRAVHRRFATKDVVSLVVQAFLGRPALFEYAARRLAGRPPVRETMGLVMGDLLPASRALDPRFLAALLRP